MKQLFISETAYTYTDSEIAQELGSRIKNLRLSSCFSQSEFARLSGVSLSTLRRVESGHMLEVSFGNILQILRAGGMMDGTAGLVEDAPPHPALHQQSNKRAYASSRMRERYERQ